MNLSRKLLVLGALGALGFSAEFARERLETRKRERPSSSEFRGENDDKLEISDRFVSPSAAESASEKRGPSAPSLDRVRSLWLTEPERCLGEAKALLLETKSPEERAELRFFMARSLVSLERFEEARDTARRMVAEAPESPFTRDAERHLLVHPFGLLSREELALREAEMAR